MSLTLNRGSVFLILLLALSVSGFILVKTIVAKKEAEIPTDLDDRKYVLSAHIGDPNSWRIYENYNFAYKIRHPISWETQVDARKSLNTVSSYEAFLSNKVVLRVLIHRSFNIPKESKKIDAQENTFYLIKNERDQKSAVIEKDNMFFQIELEEHNFFKNPEEFNWVYSQILKNFQLRVF